MRWLLLFCFSFRLFAASFDQLAPSSSEEVASLTSDLLIDGYVSAFSGQFSLSETDLRVKGAQDLVLKRTYIPPHVLGRYEKKTKLDQFLLGQSLLQLFSKGWVVNPHLWAGFNINSTYFQVRDPQGFVLEFALEGNRGVLKTNSYGCTNLRGECPNSAADIRNIQLVIEDNCAKVTWPDGIQRQYFQRFSGPFRLEREILPNGKVIRYEYNHLGLSRIVSTDPTEQYEYASITRTGVNHYVASDGREVDLTYELRAIQGENKERIIAKHQFPVMTRASTPTYSNGVGYNERYLLNYYDAKGYPVSCSYLQTQNAPARIQTFCNPSGQFSFSYHPPVAGKEGGFTTVTHPDGAQTVYRFNLLLLLEAIENHLDGQLINQKTFTYDPNQHIQCIETLDGAGNLLIAKRFECDSAGNGVVEITEGDLGTYTIKRQFDQNRLVLEEYENGLRLAYTYLDDTRLITSKTVLEFGKQLRKTLYSYDKSHNLVQVEVEGKTRTHFSLYLSAPHLHRIEWEEKSDWNGHLIHKIHYGYDTWGNTCLEEHFGSDGKRAYVIHRTFNVKGELLDETNPVGESASYQYDARGRCVYEKPFSNGLEIHRTFDHKGRLISIDESGEESRFSYNASDELIQKTDPLGLITTYRYHPVHGKPDRIEEGSAVTEIVHDAFGREIIITDPSQAQHRKTYNSYGKMATLSLPEGGIETFDYFPNGLLKSHSDADGLSTLYSYDALDRITKKTVGSSSATFEYDGYHLRTSIDAAGYVTQYQYDLSGKKIEENRNGRVTRYGYDPLGSLAWEQIGSHRIDYQNDCVGRLIEKSIDGELKTFWAYDAGGNISQIEQGGITRFVYDAHNRRIEKIDAEGNKTRIEYEKGPQVLLEKTTDPSGILTIQTYNPQHQLLKKEVEGQVVEEFEYDALQRLQRQNQFTFTYTPNGNRQSIDESGIRTTRWTYTPGNRILTQQKPDRSFLVHRYDPEWRLAAEGKREFRYDALDRLIGGTHFTRKLDAFGNIVREEWSNGLWIESEYDELDRPTRRRLPDYSQIAYEYRGPFLKKVARLSKTGREMYAQTYDEYNAKGNPLSSQGAFKTSWEYDQLGRIITQANPYFTETTTYNPSGNLVRRGNRTYTYDALSQMTSESGQFKAQYDAHYNLRELNGQPLLIDSLNQIAGLSYDANGNLLKAGFAYDDFDQLIEAGQEHHLYDALGRRIQSGQTDYLYIGDEEIGAFEQGTPKELKILGGSTPIAIEINDTPYAPILDAQKIIRTLIDWDTKEVYRQNTCDAFGCGLSDAIPYAYAGKRYDSATGLFYFGRRYYDPSLRRWLTPDPIGSLNHSNLYHYVFNNPYRYRDENGEFAFAIPLLVWGAELAIPAISFCVTSLIYGAATGAVVYGGYKLLESFDFKIKDTFNSYSFDINYNLNDVLYPNFISKSEDPALPANPDASSAFKTTNVYAPDRKLPTNENGVYKPDVNAPHTQLGTQKGRRGPYPQAREFDEKGKPVRDIDFTDHGRPQNHPNPHEHVHNPNPTGGSRIRDPDGKPVKGWNYP